jgi:hypothetical protein
MCETFTSAATFATNGEISKNMHTRGPDVALGSKRNESLLIGKIHQFPKLLLSTRSNVVLLTITLVVVIYCGFTRSLHCMQDKNSYQDGNSPIVVNELMVLVWACYK